MCSERFCVLITAGLAVAQIPCKTVAHSFRTSVACYPLHHRPLLPFINTVIDFERHVGVRHAPSQAKPPRALAARRRQDRLALSRTCACPDPGRHAGHDASEPLFAIANMMSRSRAWNAKSNPARAPSGREEGARGRHRKEEKKDVPQCRSGISTRPNFHRRYSPTATKPSFKLPIASRHISPNRQKHHRHHGQPRRQDQRSLQWTPPRRHEARGRITISQRS